MGEKAEYKSAIRSKKMIRNAFIELLTEKSLEKITVTDIVTRADINRGTFYAHYQDTRDLFEHIEDEIIGNTLEFLKETTYPVFKENPEPLLAKIAVYLEKEDHIIRVIMNSNSANKFTEKFMAVMIDFMKNDSDIPEDIKNKPEYNLQIHFFAGGIMNLFQMWFRGDIDHDLGWLTKQISEMIANA